MSAQVADSIEHGAAASDGTSPLLGLHSVAHSFGGLKVLSDVNLVAPAGSITGLIGPNGSGKTTCFNIISGFLRPRSGRVMFDGKDITSNTVQQRSRAGLVRTFQTPQVFQQMTVLENLMIGRYKATEAGVLQAIFRTPAARAELDAMRASAEAACVRFGLTQLRNKRADSLPAGQRRVLELARAHIGSPRMLLLDEPSSGLNSEEIELLREWIVTLNREGLSILLVSHDMGLMTCCDRVHVLYFGEIISSGTMASVQEDPRVREAYLGV